MRVLMTGIKTVIKVAAIGGSWPTGCTPVRSQTAACCGHGVPMCGREPRLAGRWLSRCGLWTSLCTPGIRSSNAATERSVGEGTSVGGRTDRSGIGTIDIEIGDA